MSGTTLFSDNIGQELHFSLGTAQSTDTTLDEFTCTLVLMSVKGIDGQLSALNHLYAQEKTKDWIS